MSIHTDILAQLDSYVAESAKFEGGNKSAGTRARKALGDVAKLAKARRAEIQDKKNAG